MAKSNLAITGESARSPLAIRLDLSQEKLELVRTQIAPGAPDDVIELYFERCRVMGFDPFGRMLHLTARNAKENGEWVKRWTFVTSIDGFRSIAEDSGEYDGQEKPIHEYDDNGRLLETTVTVYRKGMTRGVAASAPWAEYVQTDNDGVPTSMWRKMPKTMLAKCFSADTEVLTDRGFQRFSEVTGRILQVGESGLEAVDARPFAQDYEGPMVTLDSDDLNFSVTPNHDMITTAGKIEAGDLYEQSRARSKFAIPRAVIGSRSLQGLSDSVLVLMGAYLADGYRTDGKVARISVSRTHKLGRLRAISLHFREKVGSESGAAALSKSGRTVVTRSNKTHFDFDVTLLEFIVDCKTKAVNVEAALTLAREQVRTLVDAWVSFDGHRDKKSGVRRVFTSRRDHVAALEVMAVAAGYSVSVVRSRTSDLSTRPNYYVTISDRDAINVFRWGRETANNRPGERPHTGLELTQNVTGKVWCVTVPSGAIVVRRNGFSMLCGNCAEALALRKAFPKKLASVYTTDEMAQADNHSPAMQANAPRRDAIDAEFSPAPAALADSGPVAAPAPSRTEEVKAKVNRANVERLEAQKRAEALLEEMKADPALATPAPAPFKRDERFDDVAKVLAKINKIDSEVSKTHIMRMALGPTFDPRGGFSDSDVAAMIASAEELLGQMVSQLAKMEADSRTIPDGLFDDIPAPNSDEVRYCTDHDCGAVLAPAAIRENHIPGCRAAETLDGRL